MPDITFKFVGEDQLTPAINNAKNALSSLDQQAQKTSADLKAGLTAPLPYAFGGAPTTMWEKIQEARKAGPLPTPPPGWQEDLKEGSDIMGTLVSQVERGTMSFLRFSVVFESLHAVLNLAGAAFNQVGAAIESYVNWGNILAGSNEKAAQSFGSVIGAAVLGAKSIGETQKQAIGLYMAGYEPEELQSSLVALQNTSKQTGIDLTEVYEKVKTGGGGIAEALKVGAAGHPALRAEALDAAREANERAFTEFKISEDARAKASALQDEQRLVTREMEDVHHLADYEMAQRHRIAEQAEADQERLTARRESAATSIRGATEAALGISQYKLGMSMEDYLKQPYIPRTAIEALRPTMQAGLEALQQQLGIGPAQARAMVESGAMPVGTILSEGEAQRHEQILMNQRARAAESRDAAEDYYQRQKTTNRDLADQATNLQRDHASQREAIEYYSIERIKDLRKHIGIALTADQARAEEKATAFTQYLAQGMATVPTQDETVAGKLDQLIQTLQGQ